MTLLWVVLLTIKCLTTLNLLAPLTVSSFLFNADILEWVMRTELPIGDRLKNVPFPDPTLNTVDSPVETVYYLHDRIYTSDDVTNVKIGVWDY
jgi:hypothetical protein